ncbi:hypothetical protein [uncultured Sphingomonas sp.]|uniref:hypothetical protein n=1 Tax=uncultured Sphingomonas sp. TaxID=158754 RepID=UPI0037493FF5
MLEDVGQRERGLSAPKSGRSQAFGSLPILRAHQAIKIMESESGRSEKLAGAASIWHNRCMSIQVINLRKLLKLMFLDSKALTAALRDDIREERDRDRGLVSGGGDFYGPFWRDAKDHVFANGDLQSLTKDRIESNDRRKNIYPELEKGFLLWWNERRRWTNAPFEPIDAPKTRYKIKDLDLTVKIDCVLAVQDGSGDDHYVYPYWFPEPPIGDEAGRLGLWVLCQALPQVSPSELRILDVIRGRTMALDRIPLKGDEIQTFSNHYRRISQRRQQLRDEYDR